MVYGLQRLERDAANGNILIMVTNVTGDKQFAIAKIVSSTEPKHVEEYRLYDLALKGTIAGKDLQQFNNRVKALAQENESSLIKAGVLDAVTKQPV